jgi:hypothetical protein
VSDPALYVAGWAVVTLYVLAWAISIVRWPRRALRITMGFGIAVGLVAGAELWLRSLLKRDWDYFEELCRTRAGDRVYRTVDGVEGILRMRPRNDPMEAARDQFGLANPYGFAIGDRADSPGGEFLGRYRFVETAQRREALYGYTWEDLSTRDMRERYIAGGRFTVIDLRTNEVLAERTGFIFARHRSGGRDRDFWANLENLCPAGRGVPFWIQDFVFSVLRPAKALD